MKRAITAAALAVPLLAACSHGPTLASAKTNGLPLVELAPTATRSPSVFLAGLPTTQQVGASKVTMLVGGPSLVSAVKGQQTQFAPSLLLTFTVTATVLSGPPVTIAPTDFAVARVAGGDGRLAGPTRTVVAGKPATWTLRSVQTPGQGELVWRTGDASWSYVAEND